jgi:hypothetical protein
MDIYIKLYLVKIKISVVLIGFFVEIIRLVMEKKELHCG